MGGFLETERTREITCRRKSSGQRYIDGSLKIIELTNALAETFWVDLAIRNPLDVDVTLSSLTIMVREAPVNEGAGDHPEFVQVEVVDDIQLGAKESRTVGPSGFIYPFS